MRQTYSGSILQPEAANPDGNKESGLPQAKRDHQEHDESLDRVEKNPNESRTLCELQAFDELGGDGRDAFLRRGRKRGSWLGVRISEHDPQAGAVALITAGANGAGQLREFERKRGRVSEIEIAVLRRARLVRRMGEKIHEDAASVINEVTETLRDEDSVHIAGRGLLDLEKVVIGERILERNFDCRRGPIGVGRDMDGHNIYSFTPRELFRVGAAGENGEGAIELLGEHDAGEFVRKGHGAEGKFLMGALA